MIIVIQLLFLVYAIGAVLIAWTLLWGEINGIPFVPSNLKTAQQMLARLSLPKNTKFVDLGSGDGRIVLMAASHFGWDAVGFEVGLALNWYANLRKHLLHIPNARFISTNLLQAPLNQYDVVYIYGLPKMLQKLTPKLVKECKRGTWVICNTFRLPKHHPVFSIEKFHAYKL